MLRAFSFGVPPTFRNHAYSAPMRRISGNARQRLTARRPVQGPQPRTTEPMWGRVMGALAGFCLIAASLACGGPRPRPTLVEPPPLRPLEVAPAGATRVLMLRPAELMDSSLAPSVQAVLTPSALDRIDLYFGLRPSDVVQCVYATYGEHDWLLVRTHQSLTDTARAIASRMNTIEFESDAPIYRRAGWIGTERREVALLGEHLLAYGEPSPAFSRLVARAQESSDQPSLADQLAPLQATASATEATEASVEGPPFRLYELTPLPFPLESPLGLLLTGQQALRLDLQPVDSLVRVSIKLFGEFPSGIQENFRRLAEVLSESDVGRLAGLPEVLPSLESHRTDGEVALSLSWTSESFRRAVSRLLAPDLRALMAPDLVSPGPSTNTTPNDE